MLVTGATGFLGRAVVRRLSQDWRVRCGSRSGSSVEGGHEHARLDVATGEGLDQACGGVDAVIHCAGLAHQFDGGNAAAFDAVNAVGTGRVVATAAKLRVPRVIVASSISVYGSGSGLRDESSLCAPDTPYGRSKLAGEQAAAAAIGSDATVIILRLATLYGPRDPGNVARLAEAIRRRRFVPIGDGHNRKSLLHVDDAAEAIAQALQLKAPPGSVLTFNVSAPPVEMRAVVDAITSALGRPRFRWMLPAWPVHLTQRLWAVTGKPSPLRSIEKFLSEDMVDTMRFESATGFVAAKAINENVLSQIGVS